VTQGAAVKRRHWFSRSEMERAADLAQARQMAVTIELPNGKKLTVAPAEEKSADLTPYQKWKQAQDAKQTAEGRSGRS